MEHAHEDLERHDEIRDFPSTHKRISFDALSPRSEKKVPLKKRLKGRSPPYNTIDYNNHDHELLIQDGEHGSESGTFEDDTDHKPLLEYEENPLIVHTQQELSMPAWDEHYICGISSPYSNGYSSLEEHPFVLQDGEFRKLEPDNMHSLEFSRKDEEGHSNSNSASDLSVVVAPPLAMPIPTEIGTGKAKDSEADEVIDIGDVDVDTPAPSIQIDVDPQEMKKKKEKKRVRLSKKKHTENPSEPKSKPEAKKTVVVRVKRKDFENVHFNIPHPRIKKQKTVKNELKKMMSESQLELCNILELAWKRMRDHADASPFLTPVQSKYAPDYYTIITNPMDLRTIHEKLVRYKTHQEFLDDVTLMVKNCHMYNEKRNPDLPPMADALYAVCKEALQEMHEEIALLEKRKGMKSVSPTFIEVHDLVSSPLSVPEDSEFVDIDDSFTPITPAQPQDKEDAELLEAITTLHSKFDSAPAEVCT